MPNLPQKYINLSWTLGANNYLFLPIIFVKTLPPTLGIYLAIRVQLVKEGAVILSPPARPSIVWRCKASIGVNIRVLTTRTWRKENGFNFRLAITKLLGNFACALALKSNLEYLFKKHHLEHLSWVIGVYDYRNLSPRIQNSILYCTASNSRIIQAEK